MICILYMLKLVENLCGEEGNKIAIVFIRICSFLVCDFKQMEQEKERTEYLLHLVSYQLWNYIEKCCV